MDDLPILIMSMVLLVGLKLIAWDADRQEEKRNKPPKTKKQ